MNAIKSITRKPSPETLNQNMMSLIRKVHGMIDKPDIEKHRQSQDHVGVLLGNVKDVLIRTVEIEDLTGEWVSVNRAHMKKYVILYCHGGGYSTGSRLYARTLTTKLALSTSMDVLCFDYRLAPEHPYPAAMEDAMKAWNYLMLLGYGARDVVVAGDSAGGNMALSLVLKLKEQKRILPRGLVLMSPWTDLTSQGITHRTKAELDPVLDAAYLERMITNYVKGQEEAGAARILEASDMAGTEQETPQIPSADAEQKEPQVPFAGAVQKKLSVSLAGAAQKESQVSSAGAVQKEPPILPADKEQKEASGFTGTANKTVRAQSGDTEPADAEADADTGISAGEEAAGEAKYPVDLKDPMISPIYGSFADFPPTYIQVGENEILLSDSTMLHRKMIKENVSVKIDVFKGMWHVFQMSPLKTAYDAMEKNAEFIYDICR